MASGKSSLTVGTYITTVRRFYAWAEAKKYYPNIAKGVKTPKRAQQFKKVNTSQTRVNNSCQQFIKPKLLIMRGCVCDWSCGFHGVAVRSPRPYGSALPPYLNKRVCVSCFLFLVGVCA